MDNDDHDKGEDHPAVPVRADPFAEQPDPDEYDNNDEVIEQDNKLEEQVSENELPPKKVSY